MNWRVKAAIQNAVARLPASFSYPTYYWLQRHYGGLRRVNPMARLKAGAEVCARIQAAGLSPAGATVLEVGTGRRLNMPIAFWLCGADRVVSVDLNRYLKEELVRDDLAYIATHRDDVATAIGSLLKPERLDELVALARTKSWGLPELQHLCGIGYHAPADAARLNLPDASVHVHVSTMVFEHIPEPSIRAILAEAKRVLVPGGLLIHCIDYSDHFSHGDRSIPPIHFLRFSDAEWSRIAGNRYMYMNRLRVDDYERLFEAAGHRVIENETSQRPELLELIRSGRLPLDPRFAGRPDRSLATTSSWLVARSS